MATVEFLWVVVVGWVELIYGLGSVTLAGMVEEVEPFYTVIIL